jgi:hypothetical protein
MKQPLFFFALFALFFSCKKDDPYNVPDPASDRIRFDALAVGQVSQYIGLAGEMYYSNEYDQFSYSDDTLRLEIVAKDANGFKVKETLHYVGDVHEWLDWDKDSTHNYYLRISNDTLYAMPINASYLNSRIFTYRINKFGLPLKKITAPKIEILGWKTSIPYCECDKQGYAENYSLFGQTYDHLNVVVNNSFMAVDGPGETYVYSKGYGVVRFSTYSWWTQSGYGWDLQPEN